jgi:hypothetical protein
VISFTATGFATILLVMVHNYELSKAFFAHSVELRNMVTVDGELRLKQIHSLLFGSRSLLLLTTDRGIPSRK